MGLKYIISLFENHSISVFGEKGSGKDVLFGNVIARRKLPYISNCSYGYDFIPYSYRDIILPCTHRQLVEGNVGYYEWAHPLGADIYLSDCGVYFPSYADNELNKSYPSIPIFMSLSRHLAENAVHVNSQSVSRVWLKMREQNTRYILCEGVNKFLMKLGIVYMHCIVYDKYESACAKVKPCRVHVPLSLNPEAKVQAEIYRDNFYNQHGSVERHTILCLNRSKHDTHFFRKLFKEGKKL